MISPGGVYVAVITVLLLVALGAAIPVLKGIVIDGIERHRSGEATRRADSDDPSPGRDDGARATTADGPHTVCSNCETPNAPDFTYCRACGTRL